VQNTLAIARCPFQCHAAKREGGGPTVNQRFRETRNLDVGVKPVNRIAHTVPGRTKAEPQVEPK